MVSQNSPFRCQDLIILEPLSNWSPHRSRTCCPKHGSPEAVRTKTDRKTPRVHQPKKNIYIYIYWINQQGDFTKARGWPALSKFHPQPWGFWWILPGKVTGLKVCAFCMDWTAAWLCLESIPGTMWEAFPTVDSYQPFTNRDDHPSGLRNQHRLQVLTLCIRMNSVLLWPSWLFVKLKTALSHESSTEIFAILWTEVEFDSDLWFKML